MTGGTLPAWRSLLYAPAHVDRFVAAAHTRGADCIVLDLEDSVPPDCKEAARAAVAGATAALQSAGCDVAVRINAPLRLALEDIEASVDAGVPALCVPKVRHAQHVQMLDEIVRGAEERRGRADRCTRVDTPIVLRAHRLLARHTAIEAMASRSGAPPPADN